MNKKPKTKRQINLKQLNFKVSEDFYWKLKNLASSKRLKMLEVLEKSFKFYEKREAIKEIEINTYRQNIQEIEEQMRVFQGNISWDELELRMKSLSPEFFNKIGLVITYEVLKETLEGFLKMGRKLGMDKEV